MRNLLEQNLMGPFLMAKSFSEYLLCNLRAFLCLFYTAAYFSLKRQAHFIFCVDLPQNLSKSKKSFVNEINNLNEISKQIIDVASIKNILCIDFHLQYV